VAAGAVVDLDEQQRRKGDDACMHAGRSRDAADHVLADRDRFAARDQDVPQMREEAQEGVVSMAGVRGGGARRRARGAGGCRIQRAG
jgi:hypothetical protein